MIPDNTTETPVTPLTSVDAPSPTTPDTTVPETTTPDEKQAQLQVITQQMNNATFDAALPLSSRNLTSAHSTMVSLVRFLLDHVPSSWRTDVEDAVNTFEKAVQ